MIKKYRLPSLQFKDRTDIPVFQNQYPDIEYEFEAIVGERKLRKKKQYKIRWLGYGAEHDSWKPAENVNAPEHIEMYQQSKGVVADERQIEELNYLEPKSYLHSPLITKLLVTFNQTLTCLFYKNKKRLRMF